MARGHDTGGIETDAAATWPLRRNDLEVRLAESAGEIRAAQALRYDVFYREMAAQPTARMADAGMDFDDFDDVADHLIVIDLQRGRGADGVIGTYRLLRRSVAQRFGRFYTQDEYDIDCLIGLDGELLELGRSCVGPGYRNGPTMQLLWAGIARYVFEHDIRLMFGCASLPGTDLDAIALPLSYLYWRHLAPEGVRPRAVADRYVGMDRLPDEAMDTRAALASLPPLIRGYLRLGGCVGDGAVIDPQFNTTDVCMVVQTDTVTGKYYRHYRRQSGAVTADNGLAH